MELRWTDLPDDCRKIDLVGTMDIEGTAAVDMKLTALTTTAKSFAILDMSGVDFVASLGLGTLVRVVQAATRRGGRVVLLSPQPAVARVLAMTRLDQIIRVYDNLDDARAHIHEAASTQPNG
jgi:anti-anti-sigma factor